MELSEHDVRDWLSGGMIPPRHLAQLADEDCEECGGDGWWFQGPEDQRVMCSCVDIDEADALYDRLRSTMLPSPPPGA